MVRDWRQLRGADLAVLLFGVLALLLSFVLVSGWDGSVTDDNGKVYSQIVQPNNAWHGTALIGVILVLVATVIAAIEILRIVPLPSIGVPVSLVVAALSVVGALLIIIRAFTLPSLPSGAKDFSASMHFGGWLLIIICVVQAVAAVLRMLHSGERMPWAHPAGESAWAAPPAPPAPGVPPSGPVPPVTGSTPPPPPPGASGNA